ncbi:MAG: efflux RND transporter permease subunit, partial [Pseudomonadales bacterium]|nr:efflux RND transporter permease subunit [Pseudomonadales bacterium]
VSRNNFTLIFIFFLDGIPADEARTRVQSAVDRATLPSDATRPMVQTIDFEDMPVWTFNISSNDVLSLNSLAEELQTNLETNPLVDRVEISGRSEREIRVLVDPTTIANHGWHPGALGQSIGMGLNSFPAGNVNTDGLNLSLSIAPTINNVEDIRQQAINVGGNIFSIADLAAVSEHETINSRRAFELKDGEVRQAITLSVYKTRDSSIANSVVSSQRIVDSVLENYAGFTVNTIDDANANVNESFDTLINNIVVTILLVFGVMMIFLGVREATLASVSIPLTMLLVFISLSIMGMTLNFISLLALLLALGLLVDNAIIVVTAANSYFKQGKISPHEVGLKVFKNFFGVLISTNLTTSWAFLPLLLMTGIMGVFVRPIPIVVTISILGSALIAIFLTLPLYLLVLRGQMASRVKIFLVVIALLIISVVAMILLPSTWTLLPSLALIWLMILLLPRLIGVLTGLQKNKSTSRFKSSLKVFGQKLQSGFVDCSKLVRGYEKLMLKVLENKKNRRRAFICIILFTLFAYILPITGMVRNSFFPEMESDIIHLALRLPRGERSERIVDAQHRILTDIAALEKTDIESVVSQYGAEPRFTIRLLPDGERSQSSGAIAASLREIFADHELGEITVTVPDGGPPMGSAVQLNIYGDSFETLDYNAEVLMAFLREQSGVININKSLAESPSQINFVPDQQQLVRHGMSNADLFYWLRTMASGSNLGKITLQGTELDINLRFLEEIASIADFEALMIPTTQGLVPITILGDFRLEPGQTELERRNFRNVVIVTADVETGVSGAEIGMLLQAYAENNLDLPQGYEVGTGGANEENQRAIESLILAMIIAGLLICITLTIEFNSFRQTLIVISAIPIGVSGVFIIFSILGVELSLPAIIGILALFGLLINTSTIMVESINQHLRDKYSFTQAIISGSSSRLQPILLTSLTTIIGLIPITISDPMWRGLGGAIIAGQTFSGILTLLFVPTFYYFLMHSEDNQKRKARAKGLLGKLARP